VSRVPRSVTCGRERRGKPPVRRILLSMGFILVLSECEGTPTPGCFCKRVQNCLKTQKLSFWSVQKSSQEYEKIEVRCRRVEVRVASEERGVPKWEDLVYTPALFV